MKLLILGFLQCSVDARRSYNFIVLLRQGYCKEIQRVLVVVNQEDSTGGRVHKATRFQIRKSGNGRIKKVADVKRWICRPRYSCRASDPVGWRCYLGLPACFKRRL